MIVKVEQNSVQNKIIIYILVFITLFLGYVLLREIKWQGSTQLHTLMETIATLLAFIIGIMALVRFYSKKDHTFLLIGAGFLGTTFLDGYHTIVTSTFFNYFFPSPPPSLIPWSWIASRLFLSILLWFSWLVWYREIRLSKIGVIGEQIIYLSVGFFTVNLLLSVFSFLRLCHYHMPIIQNYFSIVRKN